ncbi:MAG TPA: TolC family protein [Chitinispirillaceae bacterium]|nr:TolC family protein [Chitinispirillaceae bacterium]
MNAVQIPASSRVISYNDAIKIAVTVNPQNRIYHSRIAEITQKRQVLKSNFLPQIDGSLNYTRFEETPPGKKYLLGDSKNDIYADITVKQLLFDGGKYHIESLINDKQIEVKIKNSDQLRRSSVSKLQEPGLKLIMHSME